MWLTSRWVSCSGFCTLEWHLLARGSRPIPRIPSPASSPIGTSSPNCIPKTWSHPQTNQSERDQRDSRMVTRLKGRRLVSLYFINVYLFASECVCLSVCWAGFGGVSTACNQPSRTRSVREKETKRLSESELKEMETEKEAQMVCGKRTAFKYDFHSNERWLERGWENLMLFRMISKHFKKGWVIFL